MESKARNKSVKRSQSPNTSKPVKKQPKLNPIKKKDSKDIQSKKLQNQDKIVKSDNDLCFKNPKYRELGFAKNAKVWKSLKQIMALQKSQSSTDSVSYASLDAPPSTKPVKKYSDISGFPALYVDPRTKLRYSDSDEYRQIQHLNSDTVVALLDLRRANF